ncbi:Lrp/AsnC ligand binding domain-containing protein [Nitrososphaera sp.]|uniref:Lrp/AsnC ligand binding domain-containing protein n=1 Tax=Nitrososphaera sp. TaxID=1971748 RepID=UPI00307E3D7B
MAITLALVLVHCTVPDRREAVEKRARRVRGVVESYATSGVYDMLLKVKAENEAALSDVIGNLKKGRRHRGNSHEHRLPP